ncbi:MAG: DNA polymerase III subunit gamma/tau [Devosiaceae bacterium]|nr:DNA polymerase III subunit gamma/tau [Devosiaceae bacterium]
MKSSDSLNSYIVLARKYRPADFSSLIGQEAMVTTFANAFKSNRIHHAYILTGVRGVGKTTTARILARAFNFEDKNGAHPTLDLSNKGVHCQEIIEGRHVDVIEMDAASNTGIDNIREIIDSINYSPASAPYKVYIIDEVHMLSTAAFNGLLKTLEEPPAHVKFIFATTEIRKVPITILSRCQRFDLRRILPETMTKYLNEILQKEQIEVEQEALHMIVRAGEGSVRDCLSLLDQGIAHGEGKIKANNIKEMLGLADKSKMIDLFEMLMRGEMSQALELTREQYNTGCDAKIIIQDLANLSHLTTRMKIVPTANKDISLTPDESKRIPEMANNLSMATLTRTWQILTSGLEEVTKANDQIQAVEMVLIRLCYVADLPSPNELIKRIEKQTSEQQNPNNASISKNMTSENTNIRSVISSSSAISAMQKPQISASEPEITTSPNPKNYAQLVALAGQNRDLVIKHALENDLRPISFEIGRIEVELITGANPSIIASLSERLKKWTNRAWLITVSNNKSNVPTIREAQKTEEQRQLDIAHEDELVQAIIKTFPDTRVVKVKTKDTDKQEG